MASKRNLNWLAPPVALLAAAFSGGADTLPLTLLYTGDANGEVEDCG
jgi:hypothetical protein